MEHEQEQLSEFLELTITSEHKEQYKRLDHLLCDFLESKSRNFIKGLHTKGFIEGQDQQGALVKLNLGKIPNLGTTLNIKLPPPIPSEAKAENIPLDILFEDEHLIIINKKAGMVTHPAPGNYTGTLVNAILYHCDDLKGIGDTIRPGIVHRLDKGTSGVMVVAKSMPAMEGLIPQFSDHSIHRKYEALTIGVPALLSGTIETMFDRNPKNRFKMTSKTNRGKTAITHYTTLARYDLFSHLEFKLETGKTHQIRVHATEQVGTPLLCDPLYGNPRKQLKHFDNHPLQAVLKAYSYPFLHAKELGFIHPISKEEVFFSTPVSLEFQQVLDLAKDVPAT